MSNTQSVVYDLVFS